MYIYIHASYIQKKEKPAGPLGFAVGSPGFATGPPGFAAGLGRVLNLDCGSARANPDPDPGSRVQTR